MENRQEMNADRCGSSHDERASGEPCEVVAAVAEGARNERCAEGEVRAVGKEGACDAGAAPVRPWTVYLIGGIGSGKSSVVARLREWGVPVCDLDETGHRALCLPEVKDALRRAFGACVFDECGDVVRRALAREAFATPEGTATLNRITTKSIVKLLDEWLARQAALAARRGDSAPVCVVEVSAYDGPNGRFPNPDEILAIVAPLEARIERAMANGFEEKDVRARIARQPLDGERRAWAGAVIENDGDMAQLHAAVDAWWLSHSLNACPAAP